MNKVVTFGEIMLRLSPPGYLRFSQTNTFDIVYGGGESNVAVSLANYGIPVEFVTRIPKSEIGECALMELRKRGVGTSHIVLGGERLGIYFMETGAVNRSSNVVYDRTNSAMAELKSGMINWDKVFDGASWFHWTGITPAISKSAAIICLEAVKVASDLGITISTDLNYRSKLWQYEGNRQEIMTELTSYCDIIFGNEEDAEMHFGIKPAGAAVQTHGHDVKAEAFLSVCQQMMKKFPRAKKVITTLRGSISASHNTWAGVLYDGKEMLQTRQYQITDIVDRVGGGDAFAGGFIYALSTGMSVAKSCDFGMAANAIKHSIPGDINHATVEEVLELMDGSMGGKVKR